jgi:hypothetical protein
MMDAAMVTMADLTKSYVRQTEFCLIRPTEFRIPEPWTFDAPS